MSIYDMRRAMVYSQTYFNKRFLNRSSEGNILVFTDNASIQSFDFFLSHSERSHSERFILTDSKLSLSNTR
jgi:hypothetical protein